ncbi:MAG: AMIN domain-containing protein, partial [Coleofasciculus sp. C2-GNP5-27]
MKQQQLLPGIWLASTLSVLVAAPAFAQVIQVTGVQVETTPRGIEVILETDSDTIPQVSTTSLDKTLLTDIFNTKLRLPEGEAFRQDNPAAGIASVTVTQQNLNTIRVAVTGTTELPTVEISPSPSGLVLSLSTPEATTQTPSPETPPPEAEDTQPPAEPEEEIEIVVTAEPEDDYYVPDASTATRTDTPLRDVPQSVQVIPQQIIEDQQVIGVEE